MLQITSFYIAQTMVKKIFLSIASAFLLWQSYELLSKIHEIRVDSVGLWFFISWIINLFITGVFAFLGFAFPTQKILPLSYYQVQDPEKLKALYETLRVEWFKKFLLVTFWRNRDQRKRYFNGKRAGISNLVEQSKKSEFGHLIPFIIINVVSVYLFAINLHSLSLFTIFLNVIGNLYPIILQRQHRMRIQSIMSKIRK